MNHESGRHSLMDVEKEASKGKQLVKFAQQVNRDGTRGLLSPRPLSSPPKRLLKENSESGG